MDFLEQAVAGSLGDRGLDCPLRAQEHHENYYDTTRMTG
jgi:hypothetical protein